MKFPESIFKLTTIQLLANASQACCKKNAYWKPAKTPF